MQNTEQLVQLFSAHFGEPVSEITPLRAAGSNRHYYRLSTPQRRAIGVIGESNDENRSFVLLARHFFKQGLPTPEVYAATSDFSHYIQEDLGDLSLFQYIHKGVTTGHFSDEEKSMLFRTIEQLPSLQFRGAQGLDFSVCYPQPAFDRNTVLWDLNYFKYCFLKATGLPFLEPSLEKDFQRLADDLLAEDSDTFLYRDFQSRNVMITNGEPRFIDFQGGRRGPIHYDVASFVWQSRAAYPASLRQELTDCYLHALQSYRKTDTSRFRQTLSLFVFFRTLQVLGAYGFRGWFERKETFLSAIPATMRNLSDLLNQGVADHYPYLRSLLHDLATNFQQRQEWLPENVKKLTVTVYSFSFKKGIPTDDSGNGGGYVFDCRGMDNPGRYEPYKQITGLDRPVIEFLEQRGEITLFLQSVWQLLDRHVSDYLRRGFTSLTVCFGCTGGQHRSVYSAQHTAEHLASKFGIRIRLIHREQGISKTLNP
ncbi:MAG: phosphotransferase [Paludibacteraceae bacterium]|nr:phosphotransferase [Paludibacteraceae bacterium]